MPDSTPPSRVCNRLSSGIVSKRLCYLLIHIGKGIRNIILRKTAHSRPLSAEVGGALGDLGTFVPYTLGAISVAGMSPVGVLGGFGLLYLASGLFYRLPIPVQPMKAVAAVMLTSGLTPGAIAASGLLIGVALLALAATGVIARLARAVPQTVSTGLQLGLGISLGWLSLEMMAENAWLGALMVIMLACMLRVPGLPATLVALVVAVIIGRALAPEQVWPDLRPTLGLPSVVLPGLDDLAHALRVTVLPQLALTVTNAIIVTAVMAGELFGNRARRVTPVNLALTSGVANLCLAPLGAMPMCHGAGGLAAHYRFGARSGVAPVLMGVALLILASTFSNTAIGMLALMPLAAVGALLLFSAIELAWSRRLVDARPECLPVIGITAGATVLADPLWGLVAGAVTEWLAGRFASSSRGATDDRTS